MGTGVRKDHLSIISLFLERTSDMVQQARPQNLRHASNFAYAVSSVPVQVCFHKPVFGANGLYRCILFMQFNASRQYAISHSYFLLHLPKRPRRNMQTAGCSFPSLGSFLYILTLPRSFLSALKYLIVW